MLHKRRLAAHGRYPLPASLVGNHNYALSGRSIRPVPVTGPASRSELRTAGLSTSAVAPVGMTRVRGSTYLASELSAKLASRPERTYGATCGSFPRTRDLVTLANHGLSGQPVKGLHGQLQMFGPGVFCRVVAETGKRLGKHHHHRNSSPRHLGGIVQRP